MGSMGYLMGGAMAGLGKGMETVGAQAEKEQVVEKEHNWQQAHDETIERLRAQHESERQASGQTFEAAQSEKKLKAASAAAGATREFEAGENTKSRASREKVGAGHDTAKVDTAAISASSRSSAGNKVKPLQSITINAVPKGPDGKPIPGALPEQKRLTFDPNTGNHYVQMGDKFYRADSTTGDAIDARTGKPLDQKATGRPVPNPTTLRALLANPYAQVPSGYKNGGMTYAEAYEREYGHLPQQYLGTVNKLSQQQSTSSSVRLPSGRMFQPGSGGAGAEGADEDVSNANEEQGADQSFQSGAMSDYAANSQ